MAQFAAYVLACRHQYRLNNRFILTTKNDFGESWGPSHNILIFNAIWLNRVDITRLNALRDLHAIHDGKIDATDSIFANLCIWRDFNQDQICRTNKLTTLAASSITRIFANSSAVHTGLGNGNLQTAAVACTRSNGTKGATGKSDGAMKNLDLLVDTYYRTFPTEHQFIAMKYNAGRIQIQRNQIIDTIDFLRTADETHMKNLNWNATNSPKRG